nr:uncharacterized protein LOC128691009 [Cherax quadricarinatus]
MSLSTTLATVIIMLTSLTNADRTEGWKISYFSVPYGQVVSHLLLFSLQPPPAEASVGFFVNGHGWTLVKDFTISSQAWHIVDIIQAMKEAALVVSPVAGINQYLKKGRLARVAVRSLQPVHWVFCSYSCGESVCVFTHPFVLSYLWFQVVVDPQFLAPPLRWSLLGPLSPSSKCFNRNVSISLSRVFHFLTCVCVYSPSCTHLVEVAGVESELLAPPLH